MNIAFTLGTILLSFFTASGVVVHSVHFDQLANTPRFSQTHDSGQTIEVSSLGSSTHPHQEFQDNTLRGFSYSSSYPAERPKYKQHMLQNAEPRGRHAFDNTYLPMLS